MILSRIKNIVVEKLFGGEINKNIALEGQAIRECVYQEFSKFYNDKDNNKKIVNSLVELLTNPVDETQAVKITKSNLLQVEIEVFSYCNRQCWFCPNKFIDRHSENHYMEEENYLKILSELKRINYDKVITFSRYNEPLADKIILTRIEQAREYCPNAFIRTNSNGDFLTKEYIGQLVNAGLNEIEIQCYLNEDEILTKKLFEEKLKKLVERLGNISYDIGYCNEEDGINATLYHNQIHITYAARNFHKIATNRGGSLENVSKYERNTNCLVPFKNVYIDYNGNYMLCCNLRSDIETHDKYILGNVKNDTVFDVFTGKKIIAFRKNVGKNYNLMSPCNTCNFMIEDKALNIVRG